MADQQGYDVAGARKAGLSDDDILGYLNQDKSYDVDGARKSGLSNDDMIGYLASRPAPAAKVDAALGGAPVTPPEQAATPAPQRDPYDDLRRAIASQPKPEVTQPPAPTLAREEQIAAHRYDQPGVPKMSALPNDLDQLPRNLETIRARAEGPADRRVPPGPIGPAATPEQVVATQKQLSPSIPKMSVLPTSTMDDVDEFQRRMNEPTGNRVLDAAVTGDYRKLVPPAPPAKPAAPITPESTDQDLENAASESFFHHSDQIGRGAARALGAFVSPESLDSMAMFAMTGRGAAALANAPQLARALENAPGVLKALDVVAAAAVPAAVAGYGGAQLISQPAPQNVEEAAETAINALLMGAGAIGAIQAGKNVLGRYTDTSARRTVRMPGGAEMPVEDVGGVPVADPRAAAANAEALRAQGQNLAATYWEGQDLNKPTEIMTDVGRVYLQPFEKGGGTPYHQILDEQGRIVAGGTADTVRNWLQTHTQNAAAWQPGMGISPIETARPTAEAPMQGIIESAGRPAAVRRAPVTQQPLTPVQQAANNLMQETLGFNPMAPGTETAAPQLIPDIKAFQKARAAWLKQTSAARDEWELESDKRAVAFMEANPGVTWEDAKAATESHAPAPQAGQEPRPEDFKTLAPPPKVEPVKEVKPDKTRTVTDRTNNVATAATGTTPESPETIAIQVAQLGAGLRRVVMFPIGPNGEVPANVPDILPEHVARTSDKYGNLYAYNTDMTNPEDIKKAAHSNKLTEILGHAQLGMGAPDKSMLQGDVVVVVVRDANGVEVQSTATDEAHLEQTTAASQALMPEGGSVGIETAEQAVGGRADIQAPAPVGGIPDAVAARDAQRLADATQAIEQAVASGQKITGQALQRQFQLGYGAAERLLQSFGLDFLGRPAPEQQSPELTSAGAKILDTIQSPEADGLTARIAEWESQAKPPEAPAAAQPNYATEGITKAEDYVGRLSYQAKKDYARAYLDHLTLDEPAPSRGKLSEALEDEVKRQINTKLGKRLAKAPAKTSEPVAPPAVRELADFVKPGAPPISWWETDGIKADWETVRKAYAARAMRPEGPGQVFLDYVRDWEDNRADAGFDRRAAEAEAATQVEAPTTQVETDKKPVTPQIQTGVAGATPLGVKADVATAAVVAGSERVSRNIGIVRQSIKGTPHNAAGDVANLKKALDAAGELDKLTAGAREKQDLRDNIAAGRELIKQFDAKVAAAAKPDFAGTVQLPETGKLQTPRPNAQGLKMDNAGLENSLRAVLGNEAVDKALADLDQPEGTPSASRFNELSRIIKAAENLPDYSKDTQEGRRLRDYVRDLEARQEHHRPAAIARAQAEIDAEKEAKVANKAWKYELKAEGKWSQPLGSPLATEAEAKAAGQSYLDRWMMAEDVRTAEVNEKPTHTWNEAERRQEPIQKEAANAESGSDAVGPGGVQNNPALAGALSEPGGEPESEGVTFTGSSQGSRPSRAGNGAVRGKGDGLEQFVRTGDERVGDAAEPVDHAALETSNDEGQTVVELNHPPKDRNENSVDHPQDYRIPDGRVISGSPERRAAANIEVLKLLKTLRDESRPATVDEQHILASYVGWGGAKQLFTERPEWADAQAQVRSLMTPEEYSDASASTMNAHYTGDNIVDAIWSALKGLGVKPGMSWLEPAVGVGNFMGRQPADLLRGSRRIGIEKDATTAAIAKLLYPSSGIDNAPFQDADLPRDYFDFSVSNVPFGKYPIFDPEFNGKEFLTKNIHNYFFVKALNAVRPGGLIAFVTSRYTMDSFGTSSQAFRKYMAGKADLIGAIRLPSGAFKQAANTTVITDIIFLRKRIDGAPAAGEAWVESPLKHLNSPRGRYAHGVNEYFTAHPEMILGTEGLQRGEFSDHDYDVAGTLTPQALADAIARLPKDQIQDWEGKRGTRKSIALRDISGVGDVKTGALFFDKKGNLFRKLSRGEAVPEDASDLVKSRVRGQLALRDLFDKLTDAERAGETNEAIEPTRIALNKAYDRYVKEHGFLSKRENQRVLLGDPDAPKLPGLERDYDQGSKKEGRPESAKKAPIFKRRLFGKTEVAVPSNAREALSLTLNERGYLDWQHLKDVSGLDDRQLADELSGLVYMDPVTKQWETADEYLSGSVRVKLRAARAIAKMDASFEPNVKALEAVQPEDVPPSRIKAILGVTWVPLQAYAQFIQETLGIRYAPKVTHIGNEWSIGVDRHPTTKWDTKRVTAGTLIDAALNLRRVKVYDRSSGTKPVINQDETIAAAQRQKELNDRFQEWLFADPSRGDAMVRLYNDLQNDLRLRKFDGSHLTLPGMSRAGLRTGNLEPYQLGAVWRMIAQKSILLNHAPGAGKSFEMIAAGMELKRLGLINRPMYVVPNSTLGGWQDQFATLYPQARVLVFSETDLAKDKRRAAVARMATGDWDAVVIPHSSFQFIPVGDAIFDDHYAKLEQELTEGIMEAEGAGIDTRIVTRMERAKETLLTNLKKRRNSAKQDNVVTWEQLGIDQVFVDESHFFKKLGFVTKQPNVAGIDRGGNQKTFDLRMKVAYTQKHGRGVVFASGTPVTNTMGELYSIMKYLIEPEMEARGIAKFDDWAAEFARIVDKFEAKPEGGGYQMKARMAEFVNLPRLATLLRTFSDVVTSDMLDIPRPAIAGGQRRAVITEMNDQQREFQSLLQGRAGAIRKDPRRALPDGMLVVYGDGGKMAMDVRMVEPFGDDDPHGRLSQAAELIHRFWKESADVKGTQLVFSDMGVPSDGKAKKKTGGPGRKTDFSVYDEITKKLIDLGIPSREIAHMGQAKTKQQRRQMFRRLNEGDLRVLIGSSDKMGVGVNVQTLGYALHHLDIPARPDILDQREARFIRQGNENPEVHLVYYTTKGSLDENKFGNVVRKGKFINDLWKGDFTQETSEDIADGVPSWEMFQAMTSGDPRIMRKMEVDSEVSRLSSLQWAFNDQNYSFRQKLQQAQSEVERLTKQRKQLEEALDVKEKAGRTWKIGGKEFSGDGISTDVGEAILSAARKLKAGDQVKIGTAHGFDVTVSAILTLGEAVSKRLSVDSGTLNINTEVLYQWLISPEEAAENKKKNEETIKRLGVANNAGADHVSSPASLVTRIENAIKNIVPRISSSDAALQRNNDEIKSISKDTGQKWPYKADFDRLVKEQHDLDVALGLVKDDITALIMDDGEEVIDDSVEAEGTETESDDEDDEDDAKPRPTSVTLGMGPGQEMYEATAKYIKEETLPWVKKILSEKATMGRALVEILDPRYNTPRPIMDTVSQMAGGRSMAEYLVAKKLDSWSQKFSKMSRQDSINFVDRVKAGLPQPDDDLQDAADFMRRMDDQVWSSIPEDRRPAYLENHFRVMWKVIPDSNKAIAAREARAQELVDGMTDPTRQAYAQDYLAYITERTSDEPEIPEGVQPAVARKIRLRIDKILQSKAGGTGYVGASRKNLRGTRSFLNQHTLESMSEGMEHGGEPVSYNPLLMFAAHFNDAMKYVTALRMIDRFKADGTARFLKSGKPMFDGYQKLNDNAARVALKTPQGFVATGEWVFERNAANLLNNMLGRDYLREVYEDAPMSRFTGRAGRSLLNIKNAYTAIELGWSPYHAVFEGIEAVGSMMGIGLRESYNTGIVPLVSFALGIPTDVGVTRKTEAIKNVAKGIGTIATSPWAFVSAAQEGAQARRGWTEEMIGAVDNVKPKLFDKLLPEAAVDYLMARRAERAMKKTVAGRQFVKNNPAAAQAIPYYFIGGGKLGLPEEFETHGAEELQRHWNDMLDKQRTGNQRVSSGLRAGLKALPASSQYMLKPLFQIYIPNLKLAFFLREFGLAQVERAGELERGEITLDQIARLVVGSVENRFGEMNFDRLFWDRTMKTFLQILFRSVTWKIGELSELGRAVYGQGKEIRRTAGKGRIPRLDPSMGWLAGVALAAALVGTVLTYVTTGHPPKDMQGLLYPVIDDSTGLTVALASYIRNYFHMKHDPAGYVKSSFQGEVGKVMDVINNQDFRHQKIWQDDDPMYQQAMDAMLHLLPEPITSGGIKKIQQGDVKEGVASMLAFSKAPAYIDKTPAELLAQDIAGQHRSVGGRSKAAADKAEAASRIRRAYKAGNAKAAEELIAKQVAAGVISKSDGNTYRNQAGRSPLDAMVKQFSVSEALRVYDKAEADEKKTLEPIVKAKVWRAKNYHPAEFGKPGSNTWNLATKHFGVKPPPAARQGQATQ